MNKLYGRGSALAGAQLEIVVCRLRARALTPQPKLARGKEIIEDRFRKAALRKPRHPLAGPEATTTPVFDGEKLAVGNRSTGRRSSRPRTPRSWCIPGRTLRVDALGNFEITFQ